MGKFAKLSERYDVDKRGDGYCVAGKWISENLDNDDLAEFIRLSNGHRWTLIVKLSDTKLRSQSLVAHVHGTCACLDGVPAKGCCTTCENENT